MYVGMIKQIIMKMIRLGGYLEMYSREGRWTLENFVKGHKTDSYLEMEVKE